MDNIIEVYDENNVKKEYKLLLVIEKEYKYLIYTDIDNNDIRKNLYAVKVKSIDNINDTIPMKDEEWQMLENEYNKLLNVIK